MEAHHQNKEAPEQKKEAPQEILEAPQQNKVAVFLAHPTLFTIFARTTLKHKDYAATIYTFWTPIHVLLQRP